MPVVYMRKYSMLDIWKAVPAVNIARVHEIHKIVEGCDRKLVDEEMKLVRVPWKCQSKGL